MGCNYNIMFSPTTQTTRPVTYPTPTRLLVHKVQFEWVYLIIPMSIQSAQTINKRKREEKKKSLTTRLAN